MTKKQRNCQRYSKTNMYATEKQLGYLAHEMGHAGLLGYTETLTASGKPIRTTKEATDKLKGLTVEQASLLIGLFRPWRNSNDDTDLLLVKQAIRELNLEL